MQGPVRVQSTSSELALPLTLRGKFIGIALQSVAAPIGKKTPVRHHQGHGECDQDQ